MMFRLFSLMCLLSTPALAAPPKVVTDIVPIQAIVARVMEGVAEVDVILRPNVSPHGAALRPSQGRVLQQSDLIIWVGPELTPWLERSIRNLAPDARTLEVLRAKGFKPISYRDDDEDEHHKDERGEDAHHEDEHHEEAQDNDHDHGSDHGHDHHGIDPHAWLDPAAAVVWAHEIAGILAEMDPEHAGIYDMNAQIFEQELNDLTDEIEALLSPVKGRSYISVHDAYQYFEARFGLDYAGSVTPGDASPASPARLAELRERIARDGITCALRDVQTNDALLRVAGENLDLNIETLDPMGQNVARGPDFYPSLLRNMAQTIKQCLTR